VRRVMWMSGILLLENQNEWVGDYSQRLLMSIECWRIPISPSAVFYSQ
jgi:hypothetical protein